MPSLTKVIHHSKIWVIRGMTYKYFTWDKDGKQSRNITHHLFQHPQISVIICVTALIASLKQQPQWSSAMKIIFQGITEHHNGPWALLILYHAGAHLIFDRCGGALLVLTLTTKFGQDSVSGLRSQQLEILGECCVLKPFGSYDRILDFSSSLHCLIQHFLNKNFISQQSRVDFWRHLGTIHI